MSPRHALVPCAVALLLACGKPSADPVLEFHRQALVLDTHADTTPWFEDPQWDFTKRHTTGHVDLPRMREGGLDAEFWSIYMGPTEGRGRAVRAAVTRMDAVHELVRRHPDSLAFATTADEVRRAVAGGRIACLMGVEGGHIIEDSLAVLRTYYRLGARYMTLTHSFNTDWADSAGMGATPLPPLHHGLTDFGEQVVREMNRLGMMVDISHVSDETFWDALRVSRAPLIASHSAMRAVANHPRNLSDEMLRALARKGGVVMINFYSGYLDADLVAPLQAALAPLVPRMAALREQYPDDPVALHRAFASLFAGVELPHTTLDRLLDHFDHAIAVAGPDHVGIGADWDGVASMPTGMEDVSRLPALTRGLLARGYSKDVVRGILGENLLRVMEEVQRVAATPEAP